MIRSTIPTVMDIKAAADRLKGKVMHTPILESTQINEQLGFRLLLKAESLQRTGSFKFRGAYNKISQIPIDKRSRGVIAYSSGNHAQGVAASAKLFGSYIMLAGILLAAAMCEQPHSGVITFCEE